MTAEPSRRLILTAGALSLAVTGCKGLAALGPVPGPAPGVATLDRAIAAEERMVATYQTALAGQAGPPAMSALLETVLAEHQAHLAQLRSELVIPRGSRSAVARPSSGPPAPALPGQPAGLLAALATAERGAAARQLHQLITAPPSLAQLLASIGAAEAAHVVLLTRRRFG